MLEKNWGNSLQKSVDVHLPLILRISVKNRRVTWIFAPKNL